MQRPRAGEPDQIASSPARQPAEETVFGKTANKEQAQLAMERARLPHSAASASSPAGFTFRDCGFCPDLVVVPKGEFTMGSNEHPYEKPEHKVKIGYPFAIGRYQITSAEWSRCADAGDCEKRPNPQRSDGNTAAAGDLSWDDANAYVKWLSMETGHVYRLPSEAEWEYAVRVGSSKPNLFEVYDTAGKMAEWVQDCWHDSYRGAPADGSAWLNGNCSLRGLRGGQFASKARFSPASARFRYDSDVRYFENGFRVLRELR
jgi:formylglycine-generating enzyme required for sulfatase activity